MVTGPTFSFEEAATLGLVHRVLGAEDFDSEVLDYARQFLPPASASLAVGHIKRAVQTGAEIPFEAALSLERELQQRLFESDDAREGIAAYLEKRAPRFRGR
jgi:enoyl-CoA hydratase/carnithine racemase